MERCRRFLAVKFPEVARRAGQAIERQFLLLETAPDIGRPFAEMPELRERVIAFGDSGYVALSSRADRQCGLSPGIPALERGRLLMAWLKLLERRREVLLGGALIEISQILVGVYFVVRAARQFTGARGAQGVLSLGGVLLCRCLDACDVLCLPRE